MDDLQSKISQILSDPKSLEQIKGLSEMLSIDNTVNSENKNNNAMVPPLTQSGSPDMMAMISKIAPLMGNINKEDDTTRLLCALKPFLSAERRSKLESAQKLLKIMKLLPLIKDSNIIDSLF